MRLLALAPLLLLAAPAAAQTAPGRTFALPAGCTAYLTVQGEACSVSHYFTCEGDAEGINRRVDMDEDGVNYFGAIDAETQWIESFHTKAGYSERLEDNPVDRASFTALTTQGVDTYDFRTLSAEVGETRYVGQDRLTGVTQTIDGVTLEQTEYAIRAYDAQGSEMWRATGNEWISRDWRMFLSGSGRTTTPDESWETSDNPVDFIYPGEAGFLSVTPRNGCGMMMSKASIQTGAGDD